MRAGDGRLLLLMAGIARFRVRGRTSGEVAYALSYVVFIDVVLTSGTCAWEACPSCTSSLPGVARPPGPWVSQKKAPLLQVVRERQTAPYSRADVVFWPDEEEVDAWRGPALAAVDAAAGAPQLMTAIMYAADRAACAASAASAQACLLHSIYDSLSLRF